MYTDDGECWSSDAVVDDDNDVDDVDEQERSAEVRHMPRLHHCYIQYGSQAGCHTESCHTETDDYCIIFTPWHYVTLTRCQNFDSVMQYLSVKFIASLWSTLSERLAGISHNCSWVLTSTDNILTRTVTVNIMIKEICSCLPPWLDGQKNKFLPLFGMFLT